MDQVRLERRRKGWRLGLLCLTFAAALWLFHDNRVFFLGWSIDGLGRALVPSAVSAVAGAADRASAATHESAACAVPVLLYHGLDERSDESVSISGFRSQMKALADNGYRTVSLREYQDWLDGSVELPEKSILITFDDGRRDSFLFADPILASQGQRAVLFALGPPDPERGDLVLNLGELGRIERTGRWEVASHGSELHSWAPSYPAGARAPWVELQMLEGGRAEPPGARESRVMRDLVSSRRVLEDALGHRVDGFAYPFGRADSVDDENPDRVSADCLALSVYRTVFVQVRGRSFQSQNYRSDRLGTGRSLSYRIEVDPSWSARTLLDAIEAGKPKTLPYESRSFSAPEWRAIEGWAAGAEDLSLGRSAVGPEGVPATHRLNQRHPADGTHTVRAAAFLDGSRGWADYRVALSLKRKADSAAQLLVRCASGERHIAVTLAGDELRVDAVDGIQRTSLGAMQLGAASRMSGSGPESEEITATVVADTIRVETGGQAMSGSLPSGYRDGGLGLAVEGPAYAGAGASFSELRVESCSPSLRSVAPPAGAPLSDSAARRDRATGAVPDVTRMNIGDARAALERAGYPWHAVLARPSQQPQGIVIAQSPPPGTAFSGTGIVRLTYSSGW